MNIISANACIAVEPFPTASIQPTLKTGFAVVKQKAELTPLKVVFDYKNYSPGMTVWVRGDACKHTEALEVYHLNGKSFILIPEAWVKLVGWE